MAVGFNTWNVFRCGGVTAEAIMSVADKMVELGLADLGYKYLNIDDCWATAIGPDGGLVADPKAFPDGIRAVADAVHAKGLRLGIYGDRGSMTCASRPGSGGRERVHARQFAEWGIDYLKYDSCWASSRHDTAFDEYGRMRDALNATGRPILFSLCGWNAWYAPMGDHLGNSWRIAPQLASKSAGWPRVEHRLLAPPGGSKCSHRPSALRSAAPAPWKLGAASDAWLRSLPRQDEDLPPPSDRQAPDTDEWANVYVAVRTNEALAKYASPGAFNDPDMLVGSSAAAPVHFTPRQVQTQFSLWAVMAAPLLIGSPLTGMPASDLATYSNPEVIAVSQDPMGVQGEVVWSNCPPFQPLPATAAPWPLSLQPAGQPG